MVFGCKEVFPFFWVCCVFWWTMILHDVNRDVVDTIGYKLVVYSSTSNNNENNNKEQLNTIIRNKLRHNTQLWEKLLYTTGGKLELTKCKFTILNWNQNKTSSNKKLQSEPIKIKDRKEDRVRR